MLGYIFVPEGKTLKKSSPYMEFKGPVMVIHHRLLKADLTFTDGTDYAIYNDKEEAEYLQAEDAYKNREFKKDSINKAKKALKSADKEIAKKSEKVAEKVAEKVEEEEVVICEECDFVLEDCLCDE